MAVAPAGLRRRASWNGGCSLPSAIGCIVGFLAGLLGIGGGMTVVPLLTLIFTHEHFPQENILHMAIATSTAIIVFTSVSSVPR